MQVPFYDPFRTYEENYQDGPFGDFANSKKIKRVGKPKHVFCGNEVYMPFGIPAGPLLNSAYVKSAFDKGFDISVYKTVRTRKHACHPWPNVLAIHPQGDIAVGSGASVIANSEYVSPLSITNSFGVPSMDPDVWQPDMKKAVKFAGAGQVMIGSFQGTSEGNGKVDAYIRDFVLGAKLVKETGAKILEANLSCPNEGTADVLCFDLERTFKIAVAIKEEIGNTPLILKMAYFEDDRKLHQFVEKLGKVVQGFAAINTIPKTIIDSDGRQALPGKGRERSGVCGEGIRWAGLEMVRRIQSLREKLSLGFSIIGVGGVTTFTDYDLYRRAGADVVMSATGAMWNPRLAKEIYDNLAKNS